MFMSVQCEESLVAPGKKVKCGKYPLIVKVEQLLSCFYEMDYVFSCGVSRAISPFADEAAVDVVGHAIHGCEAHEEALVTRASGDGPSRRPGALELIGQLHRAES